MKVELIQELIENDHAFEVGYNGAWEVSLFRVVERYDHPIGGSLLIVERRDPLFGHIYYQVISCFHGHTYLHLRVWDSLEKAIHVFSTLEQTQRRTEASILLNVQAIRALIDAVETGANDESLDAMNEIAQLCGFPPILDEEE